MSDAYSVKVKIEADASGYAADLKKAQSQTTELGKTTGKTSGLVSRFGTELQVAGAVGVAALGALALSSVKAASDLEESANAVGKAFGPAADDIMELGENAAEMYGMSEKAFRQFSVRFSGFADDIATGSGADIGTTVDDISTRVADLASVMNMDIEAAATVFTQSLAGETEAAKMLGIDVSAAAVEAYALANGIGSASGALTSAETVTARYGLLMQETEQYAGDFADTSDGLANQQRILAANFEDAKASLGTSLLPVMTQVVGVAADLLDGFAGLPPGVQGTTLAVAALGAGLLIVVPRIAAFNASLAASNMTAKQFATSMGKGGVYGALAAIAAIQLTTTISEISGLSGAIDSLGDASSTDEAREKIKALRAEIDSTTDVSIFEMASGVGMLDSVWAKVSGTLGDAESQIVATEAQVSAFDAMIRSIASETGASEEALSGAAESMGLFGEGAGYAGEQLRGWVAEQANGKTAAGQLAGATETLGDVTATAADKVSAFKDAIDALNGSVASVSAAEAAWEAALDDATAALAENKGATDLGTAAGRANFESLDDMRQAAIDHAAAVYEQTGSMDEANGVLAAHRDALYAAALKAGLSKDEVDALIGSLDTIPASVTTDVATGAPGAKTGVDSLDGALDRLDGRSVSTDVATGAPGAKTGVDSLDGALDGLDGRSVWAKIDADTGPAERAVDTFIREHNGRRFVLSGDAVFSVGAERRATGGMVTGPGTTTSDSIPALLSNKEYVIRASSVAKYGVGFFDAVNAGRFASGGLVGGRPVGAVSGAAAATYVTVNVGGSVTSERDLVRAVRDGLSEMAARGDAA